MIVAPGRDEFFSSQTAALRRLGFGVRHSRNLCVDQGTVEGGREERERRDTDAGALKMQVCILPAQELARCGV